METMLFRKIYWVTEMVGASGQSEVTGVFTSVHDLVDKGLPFLPGTEEASLRLSLVQLDSPGVLGRWNAPGFEGLGEEMDKYVATGEMAEHDKESLLSSLGKL